jgi:NADPH:quinone reductase-like Zn-dependent oxidoreductase
MKKVIYNQYGDFSQLKLVDVERPTPLQDEVVVKVKAVAINPLDWKILEGQLKFLTGKKFPRSIGIEFSGTVEDIGGSVVKLKIGDKVFGMVEAFKGGALAEFISVKESILLKVPNNLDFEHAAAIPIGALSALQLIDDLCKITTGHEVLINGATGGVGTFAIQIAKLRGATVTSVVSGRGVDHAKFLGSDFIIDYSKQDIHKLDKRFDVIIDLSNKLKFSTTRHLLKQKSVFANADPNPVDIITSAIHNLFSGQKRHILKMKYNPDQMAEIGTLIENGLKVVVGKTFRFGNFQDAYSEVKKSGALGKAVIQV